MKVLHYLGIGRLPERPMVDATGGTERSALEIARIQTRRGHQVTVASQGAEEWSGAWEGVRLMHLKAHPWASRATFGKVPGSHARLVQLVRSGNFDLVHLHECVNTRFFGRRAKLMHFHNNPLDGCEPAEFAARAPKYWSKVGKSARQLAVSEFLAGRLRLAHANAGPDALPQNIVRVPGGVSSDVADPEARRVARAEARQRLGLKDEDVLFLFCGAIRPEKGVDYLARAFAKLSATEPGAYLAIAGGTQLWVEAGWLWGGELDATERQVRETLADPAAKGRAFMLGIVSPQEIAAYYAACDVFVLPSMFQETFGLVLLEAFSAGRPVIAFRSGGIPELVRHRENGLLVDQGDENGLYEAMRELLLDRELRERLGAAAETVPPRYSWEATVDQLDDIYRAVISPEGAPGGQP